jgi:exoribonuclease R
MPTNTIIWRSVLRLSTPSSLFIRSQIVQGSVPAPAFTKPILLVGRENMNRAVQGDVVVVEVFDEKEWKAPADEVVDQEGTFRTPLAELLANLSLKLPSKMMMLKTRVRKTKEIKRFL